MGDVTVHTTGHGDTYLIAKKKFLIMISLLYFAILILPVWIQYRNRYYCGGVDDCFRNKLNVAMRCHLLYTLEKRNFGRRLRHVVNLNLAIPTIIK